MILQPSSSGRSAEILGAAVPAFVGFTAVENAGLVPIVPGFGNSENLYDEIDPNIDNNFQLGNLVSTTQNTNIK